MPNHTRKALKPATPATLNLAATSLHLFVKAFRNGSPLPGEPTKEAIALATLFSDMGPEVVELSPLLKTFATQSVEDVSQSSSSLAATFKTWVTRHRVLIEDAFVDFCAFYTSNVEQIRLQTPNFPSYVYRRIIPACVFEAVALAWIYAEKHAIFETAAAMFAGGMFGLCLDERARDFNSELVQNVRQLHSAGTALNKQIELMMSHMGNELPIFDEIKISIDQMLVQVGPIIEDVGSTGRPPEPIKPFVIGLLHKAGLTNGDIGKLAGTGVDAIRKQRARRQHKAS